MMDMSEVLDLLETYGWSIGDEHSEDDGSHALWFFKKGSDGNVGIWFMEESGMLTGSEWIREQMRREAAGEHTYTGTNEAVYWERNSYGEKHTGMTVESLERMISFVAP